MTIEAEVTAARIRLLTINLGVWFHPRVDEILDSGAKISVTMTIKMLRDVLGLTDDELKGYIELGKKTIDVIEKDGRLLFNLKEDRPQ